MSVLSVAVSQAHVFSKQPQPEILLVTKHGVHNDCHAGTTVQHRSRLHIRPPPANLRQVHVQSAEQLGEFGIEPAALGENVTVRGIDLSTLGEGWLFHFRAPADYEAAKPVPNGNLHLGDEIDDALVRQTLEDSKHEGATIKIRGVRNPCPQIEKYQKGLQEKFVVRDEERKIVERKAGIMATVERGGWVRVGMDVVVERIGKQHAPLQPV